MKLAAISVDGARRPGIVTDEGVIDIGDRFDTVVDALQRTTVDGSLDGSERDAPDRPVHETDTVSWRPPTTERNRVLAAAMNYPAGDAARPETPLLFSKFAASLVGHREPIAAHGYVTSHLDFEGELAIVIGRSGFDLDPSEAIDHVGGYTIITDTTARDQQWLTVGDREYLDWFSAKGLEGATPLGPWIVTADAVDDPEALTVRSTLNGEPMQDGYTGDLIHNVADLVAFASSRLRLQPGDVIATGAPGGTEAFDDVALDPGDRVEVTIDGIGTLTNHCGT